MSAEMVAVPLDVARELARQLRLDYCSKTAECQCSAGRVADLLDPAPTMRDQIAALYRDEIVGTADGQWSEISAYARQRAYAFADKVVALVAITDEATP